MKVRGRLTREASQEAPRPRLLEAAGCLFIRKGFEPEQAPSFPAIARKSPCLLPWAVVHGLGTLAIETGPERKRFYTKAVKLAFDRLTAANPIN